MIAWGRWDWSPESETKDNTVRFIKQGEAGDFKNKWFAKSNMIRDLEPTQRNDLLIWSEGGGLRFSKSSADCVKLEGAALN